MAGSQFETSATREGVTGKIAIKPLTESLKKRFIDASDYSREHVKRSAREEHCTVEQYFEKWYRSFEYNGEEYLVVFCEPSEDSGNEKVEFVHQKEGPVIYIDRDIPESFLDILILHEVSEIKEAKKLRQSIPEEAGHKGTYTSAEYDIYNRRVTDESHRFAVQKEEEYAAQTRTPEEFEAYRAWKEEFLKKYAGY